MQNCAEVSERVHPHPLNREDIESLGVEILEQFKDWTDLLLSSLQVMNPESIMHYCCSHKATVSIVKMSKILDIDNCEEFTSYRCSDCSKSVKCKTSTLRHAISL